MKTHAILAIITVIAHLVHGLPPLLRLEQPLSETKKTPPTFASRIEDCPALLPRQQTSSSVHDLRPDDIEIVAAIGDSISAGVAAINIDSEFLTLNNLKEHRGIAFSMGGDAGALTFPNLIQHYKSGSNLVGPSVGVRQLATCPGTIFCTDGVQDASLDHLNAAIPAATTLGFEQQANYLIDHIGKRTAYNNKWKIITVFLGMNDMAISCQSGFSYIEAAKRMSNGLDLLLQNIDYALINVVGPMHIEKALGVTEKEPGYRKQFQNQSIDIQLYECTCCHTSLDKPSPPVSNEAKAMVGTNIDGYAQTLRAVAEGHMNKNPAATTTVTFIPFNLDIANLPAHVFSNVDGYHPNVLGHHFLAKSYWNQLFLPSGHRKNTLEYDSNLSVQCPNDSDRFQTM